MSFLYIVAGVYHFVNPGFYRKMMPPWLPCHNYIILVSGIFEVVLAILLLPTTTRAIAAWGIIILLILIFPANIQMTLNFYRKKHRLFWVSVLRLPLQFFLVGWAWLYT